MSAFSRGFKLEATNRRFNILRNNSSVDLFEVVAPGMLTTVQDLGRFGYQRFGVPVAGAMDSYAAKVANILAGNAENAACLEMTIMGPTLKVLNPCNIAITGADLSPTLNGERIDMWARLSVKKGDMFSFSSPQRGCRAYLSVSGGIDVPSVLGSRSTYLRGGFGGYRGRALRRGDLLRGTISESRTLKRYVPQEYVPKYASPATIRVVLGTQDDFFTDKGIETFLNSKYEVTPDSDRMGYRLHGQAVTHSKESEIVSDGLAVGAIQVPGDRMPIVLMKDAPTTGGYPKIAHVISPDLDQMAQLTPGDALRFERIEIGEAHELLRQAMRRLGHLKENIKEGDWAP
jgi:biotin-dependent carboxylase-like uncharacterized protein